MTALTFFAFYAQNGIIVEKRGAHLGLKENTVPHSNKALFVIHGFING